MPPGSLTYDGKLPRIFSPASGDGPDWPQIYVGIAMTTLATLILELSLARIIAVIFDIGFVPMGICVALFGLAGGGVLSCFVAAVRPDIYRRLGWLSAGIGLCSVLALLYLLTHAGPERLTFAALPFVLAGTVLSLAVSDTVGKIHQAYFFYLIGAAGGCLVLVPFLNTFGGPNTVIIAGALFAASSAVWFNLGNHSRGRAAGVALALVLVFLVVVNTRWRIVDVTYAKGRVLAGETFVKWNSFSRV
ncbi:MAG: hypothetical protein H7Y20_18050, partial [Bryobacteraceae bacterium]|nr:hypothetical protein [Bryobacteraceae bacterium]